MAACMCYIVSEKFLTTLQEARYNFLVSQTSSVDLSTAEKGVLERKLLEWVTSGEPQMWWSEDNWDDCYDIVQWHVRQWLKARKQAGM